MGNHQCTPPQPIVVAPPQIRTTKQRDKDVKAVRSISNPSLVSQLEDEEEQVETSISQQFNESYMELVFLKFSMAAGTALGTEEFMPNDSIKSIMNIFDTISMDENIMYLATKISESLARHNDTWAGIFNGCAERNPLKYAESKGFVTDNRIIMHAMMVFRTLKVITISLEEGNLQQVTNLLDLVSLSHLVMKVQPSLIRSFLVCMIRNLLHYKIVSDETLPVFVNFNMKILLTLQKHMETWEERHIVLLNQMFDGPSAPAREYYRELKNWRTYVVSCYKYLAKPLNTLEKQIQSAHKLLPTAPVENTSYENWKIIRCLKRGYKYKNKNEYHNHHFLK